MAIEFTNMNVFTETASGGNPLAVITGTQDMDDATMLRIARHFNYSEITFVLPPDNPQHTAKVRIFTPLEELDFAGHPNVGTAFILGRRGRLFDKPVSDEMIFEEKLGLVKATLLRENGVAIGASVAAPKPLELGDEVSIKTLLACTSLDRRCFDVGMHNPRFVSVGLSFVVAQLDSVTSLNAVQPSMEAFIEAKGKYQRFSIFLYVPDNKEKTNFHARMFSSDTHEDPATGSASAAFGAYRAHIDPRRDGDFKFVIKQGFKMGHPSIINIDVEKRNGVIGTILISGSCVEIDKGPLPLAKLVDKYAIVRGLAPSF